MPIYDIEILVRGKSIGAKVVTAPSASYIRQHKNRFVGADRRIGEIIPLKAKTENQAMRTVRKNEGWSVRNGVRVYKSKPKKRRTNNFSLGSISSLANFKI